MVAERFQPSVYVMSLIRMRLSIFAFIGNFGGFRFSLIPQVGGVLDLMGLSTVTSIGRFRSSAVLRIYNAKMRPTSKTLGTSRKSDKEKPLTQDHATSAYSLNPPMSLLLRLLGSS